MRRDGDDFILNGQKSSWVSTAPIAGAATIFATYEQSKHGLAEGAVFLLPLDLPGITRGSPWTRSASAPCARASFFDNVRVPRQFFLLDGPDVYPQVLSATLREANIGMGMMFIGVARAAYEHR